MSLRRISRVSLRTWNALRSRGTIAFGQEGEDLVLRRLFEELRLSKQVGFYVDVGAHHPSRFSNTYFWYLRGWRGINIDATPGCMELFKKRRTRDINLECGVSNDGNSMEFFVFNEPALNSFDAALSREREEDPRYRIVDRIVVPTRKLARILDASLPDDTVIDFLTVDVEGHDLDVLQSNDWDRYRPNVVLAEDSQSATVEASIATDLHAFMHRQGYRLFSKTVRTLYFVRQDLLTQ